MKAGERDGMERGEGLRRGKGQGRRGQWGKIETYVILLTLKL